MSLDTAFIEILDFPGSRDICFSRRCGPSAFVADWLASGWQNRHRRKKILS